MKAKTFCCELAWCWIYFRLNWNTFYHISYLLYWKLISVHSVDPRLFLAFCCSFFFYLFILLHFSFIAYIFFVFSIFTRLTATYRVQNVTNLVTSATTFRPHMTVWRWVVAPLVHPRRPRRSIGKRGERPSAQATTMMTKKEQVP